MPSRLVGWPAYPRVFVKSMSCPHRNHIPGGARLAKLSPCLHKSAPLFQRVATPVSLLHSAAGRVRQRLLGDLPREACFFARPIPEGRAETVNPCTWYERGKRRAGQWAPPPPPGKYKIAGPDFGHALDDLHGTTGQRNAMQKAGLHAGSGNGPDLRVDVDLVPRRTQNLAGSGRRHDQEFERQCRDRFSLAQLGNNLGIGQGRMVPAGKLLPPGQDRGQVIAPCRRVFTGSKAVGFCVIKHRLDPAAKARSCFWNPVPNRLQDRKNRHCVYRVDRLIEDRPAIIIDRCAPLLRVDLAAPFAPFGGYERSGAFAEGFAGRCGSWTFLFSLNGRQREAGFGSAATVTLAEARERAADYRSMLAKDKSDPLDAKKAASDAGRRPRRFWKRLPPSA
jgi:hypothetical protein